MADPSGGLGESRAPDLSPVEGPKGVSRPAGAFAWATLAGSGALSAEHVLAIDARLGSLFLDAATDENWDLEKWIRALLDSDEKADYGGGHRIIDVAVGALGRRRRGAKTRRWEFDGNDEQGREEKQPSKRPRLEPRDDMEVDSADEQGREGKQTQRRPPLFAYMQDIVATHGSEAAWKPGWTHAINRLTTERKLIEQLLDAFDEEEATRDVDARSLISRLKSLAELSNEAHNPFKIAADAIRWNEGIPGRVVRGGFGSLDTSEARFRDRPAFPEMTQLNLPVTGGQHRRHVLAWHTIRDFVSLAFEHDPATVLAAIRRVFDDPDPVGGQGHDEQRDEHGADAHTQRARRDPNLRRPFQAGREMDCWNGQPVYHAATSAVASMLWFYGDIARADFESSEGGAEEEHVRQATEWAIECLVSNLEIDSYPDDPEQAPAVFDKAKELESSRMTIDNVMNRNVPLADLEPEILAALIEDFLTYL